MGRESLQITIRASVSRHNSEQDRLDDALWTDFVRRIAVIASDPKYSQIGLDGPTEV